MSASMDMETFIKRWQENSGGAERARLVPIGEQDKRSEVVAAGVLRSNRRERKTNVCRATVGEG